MTPRATVGDADERRARRERQRVTRRRRRRAIVAAVAVAVIVAGVGLASVGSGRIPPRVSIAGVDVGGRTPEAARARVEERARDLRDRPLRLVSDPPGAFALTVDGATVASAALVDEAVAEARDARGPLGRIAARLGIAGERQIPLRFALNDDAVAEIVRTAGRSLGRPAVSARVTVEGERVVTHPARAGVAIDRAALVAGLAGLPESVAVPVREARPEVSDAEATDARELAERVAGRARTVTLDGRSAELTATAARNALRFPVRRGAPVVTMDQRVLRSALLAGLGVDERMPRDARLRISGSAVTVVPSSAGRRLDTAALAAAIVANPGGATVAARVATAEPDFTTGEARALRVTEKVSEFTTPYACCQPRVRNIQRAAEILDHTIIPAGGRFSLNDALGERTEARGFTLAPAIAAGELVDTVGGGVSQVATTMYNAAFFAGLELVAHTPHEFYISRYPMGREATVSWRSPDLVFRNDWPAAILMSVRAGSNGITVAFYSSMLGRRVETETGTPTSRTQPRTIERSNPSLPPGTRRVIQGAGAGGFSVSYTRTVYRGTAVKRSERFSWRYRPENAIVEIGPPAPEAPETPAQRPEEPEPRAPAPAGGTPPATTTGAAPPAPPTP